MAKQRKFKIIDLKELGIIREVIKPFNALFHRSKGFKVEESGNGRTYELDEDAFIALLEKEDKDGWKVLFPVQNAVIFSEFHCSTSKLLSSGFIQKLLFYIDIDDGSPYR